MMINIINQKGFLGWISIFVVLAIFIISGTVIAINLPNSLPGELIYPIKGVLEDLHLAINELSYEGRVQIYTELSNNRLNEFRGLVSKRKLNKIAETLDRMILMQKRALENLGRVQIQTANITLQLSALEASLQKQQDVLQKLQFQVLPQDYDVINKAIRSTEENLEEVNTIETRK